MNDDYTYTIETIDGVYMKDVSREQAVKQSHKMQMSCIPHTVFKKDKEGKLTTVSMNFLDLTSKVPKEKIEYDITNDGTGKKYDTGKPMIGTIVRVFPLALEALGEVMEFGTHKYPKPDNWKKVDGAKYRYLDSLMRHMVKHYKGLELDEETGKPHLAHMAWNALAILELYLMEKNEEQQK